ncbi:MAG: cyclopropane-fatty-acyl-phospholipid synthase family protein [Gemmatimonadota bacterium]
MSLLDRMCETAVRHRMSRIAHGQLTLRHRGVVHQFGAGGAPEATMDIEDPAFFRALTLRGHLGAAESYVRGEWSSPELADVIRVFARNREALDGLETGWARLARPALAAIRLWNRNTRRGSARNIHAHYDLGNEFFASFLDDTMTYSCGIFETGRSSLRDASVAKYDRICRKLQLRASDHVIEIGSGWGGFAIHAASTYGCRVTTTTISREQHALATERIAEAGLEDRVTVLLRDYRDLEGTYDKLVSIEMVEAVGHQFLDTYFEKCASLLAHDGIAAIQAITVQDGWYDPRQRQVDFIKRYIFPGSFVPAISTLAASSGRTDLRLVHLEDITAHYAETLRRWRVRFDESWDRIRSLGFDERFRRLWEFYFCYCEGGFDEAVLGDVQLVFAKPLAKGSLVDFSRSRVAAVA